MTYFPGDPAPQIHPAQGIQNPWMVSEIHFGSHTGTHIDAPAHYIPGGKTIDQYPLERFIQPGVVTPPLNLQDEGPIQPKHIINALNLIPKGGALLLQTNWDRFWNTERYFQHPFLTIAAAEMIADSGIGILGIDSLNIDSTTQGSSDAHQILLNQDVLIVENLTGLFQLTPMRLFRFSFIPLFLVNLDGSPIRAYATDL